MNKIEKNDIEIKEWFTVKSDPHMCTSAVVGTDTEGNTVLNDISLLLHFGQSFTIVFDLIYADTRFFSTCGGFIIRINAPTEIIKKFIMPPSRENNSSTVFACVLTENA